ncbi:hypothetical protein [Nocardia goodfellowii]|uniref:Ig-like domain-containing protein n=1 Tax=Nocardia goodfellowii TaxID=882446 RepID=A0ABS4QIF7_9NOCA|nr:hypothetical protein [Nocardia goodfellowii]MBP2191440.1 hypothetical protein [Nocardia goodfellowii]
MYKKIASLAAASVLAAALVGITASPATAVVDSLTCAVGSSTTTYDPPITMTQATTTRTIDQVYGPLCVGTGSAAGITSGTHYSSNTTSRSCLQLLSTGNVSWTITWNTGQTSTVSTSRVSNVVGAVFSNVFTGTVTAGVLQGHTLIENMTAPSLPITLCTAGLGNVSQLNSVHTLEIAPL